MRNRFELVDEVSREQSSESVGSAMVLFSATDVYETHRRETAWNGLVPNRSLELLTTIAPLTAEMEEHLESCVCGHSRHPGSECDGGCGCTTFEPDEGMGWVRAHYIFKATSIHPQGTRAEGVRVLFA